MTTLNWISLFTWSFIGLGGIFIGISWYIEYGNFRKKKK